MSAPAPCDLIVAHGLLVTVDAGRRVIPDGAVAIAAGRIVAVGPAAGIRAAWTAPVTIDAAGGIVHPAFTDGHLHAGLHLIRGALPDDPHSPPPADPAAPGPFVRWLNALTEADEVAATRLAALEMMLAGFTGFVEAGTALWPDAVAETAEACGIRVSVADPPLWDLDAVEPMAGQVPRAPCDLDRALATLGGQLRRNRADGLARGHVGLYGMGSASDLLMTEAKRVADGAGAMLHQHQSFAPGDVEADTARLGRPPLVHFAERGLIGPSSVFTHMNILTEAEAEAVLASGMALGWHPGNAIYYGIAPRAPLRFPAFHRAGVTIALSVDVAKCWSFGDLGPVAYLLARQWGDYLPAEAILEMHTRGGARALGLAGTLGALEPGMRADLVLRRADLPEAAPGFDPVRHLVLIQRGKGVDTVICAGRVIVRHGAPVALDAAGVIAAARASARRVAEASGVAPAPRWPLAAGAR